MPAPQYHPRIVDAQLDEYAALPAVAIDGPKGVGKTTTAAHRARTTFRLDDPAALATLQADPGRLTHASPPVLIDEWQHYPPSWDLVRRAVDDGAPPGSFLLTGSASPQSPQTHSGAGRVVTLRMRPLTLPERGTATPSVSLQAILDGAGTAAISGETTWGLESYVDAILTGGFPGMMTSPPTLRRALLAGYLDRIVDRDFPDAGRAVRNPGTLRRWLVAFAKATGTTASFETIRDAAATGHADPPARSTTIPFRDTLERIWISDPVSAWSPLESHGLGKLTSSPKHFLADPALAAALLDVDADVLLSGRDAGPPIPRQGTLLGGLFESLAALSLQVFAQAADAGLAHLRTHGGQREIDFIVHGRGRRQVALEVKLTAVPDHHDVKHLLWLKEQMGPALTDMVVVTTGRSAYRRADGVAVVPLSLLGP